MNGPYFQTTPSGGVGMNFQQLQGSINPQTLQPHSPNGGIIQQNMQQPADRGMFQQNLQQPLGGVMTQQNLQQAPSGGMSQQNLQQPPSGRMTQQNLQQITSGRMYQQNLQQPPGGGITQQNLQQLPGGGMNRQNLQQPPGGRMFHQQSLIRPVNQQGSFHGYASGSNACVGGESQQQTQSRAVRNFPLRGSIIGLESTAQQTILNQIRSTYADDNYSAQWDASKVQGIKNPGLAHAYNVKKKEMQKKYGSTSPLCNDSIAFLCISSNENKLQDIKDNGLQVKGAIRSQLGDATRGVILFSKADILLKLASEQYNQSHCNLIVFSIIMGNTRTIPVPSQTSTPQPSPNFDSHIPQQIPNLEVANPINNVIMASQTQVYLYEFNGDGTLSTRPRQVLPIAIIKCRKKAPRLPPQIQPNQPQVYNPPPYPANLPGQLMQQSLRNSTTANTATTVGQSLGSGDNPIIINQPAGSDSRNIQTVSRPVGSGSNTLGLQPAGSGANQASNQQDWPQHVFPPNVSVTDRSSMGQPVTLTSFANLLSQVALRPASYRNLQNANATQRQSPVSSRGMTLPTQTSTQANPQSVQTPQQQALGGMALPTQASIQPAQQSAVQTPHQQALGGMVLPTQTSIQPAPQSVQTPQQQVLGGMVLPTQAVPYALVKQEKQPLNIGSARRRGDMGMIDLTEDEGPSSTAVQDIGNSIPDDLNIADNPAAQGNNDSIPDDLGITFETCFAQQPIVIQPMEDEPPLSLDQIQHIQPVGRIPDELLAQLGASVGDLTSISADDIASVIATPSPAETSGANAAVNATAGPQTLTANSHGQDTKEPSDGPNVGTISMVESSKTTSQVNDQSNENLCPLQTESSTNISNSIINTVSTSVAGITTTSVTNIMSTSVASIMSTSLASTMSADVASTTSDSVGSTTSTIVTSTTSTSVASTLANSEASTLVTSEASTLVTNGASTSTIVTSTKPTSEAGSISDVLKESFSLTCDTGELKSQKTESPSSASPQTTSEHPNAENAVIEILSDLDENDDQRDANKSEPGSHPERCTCHLPKPIQNVQVRTLSDGVTAELVILSEEEDSDGEEVAPFSDDDEEEEKEEEKEKENEKSLNPSTADTKTQDTMPDDVDSESSDLQKEVEPSSSMNSPDAVHKTSENKPASPKNENVDIESSKQSVIQGPVNGNDVINNLQEDNVTQEQKNQEDFVPDLAQDTRSGSPSAESHTSTDQSQKKRNKKVKGRAKSKKTTAPVVNRVRYCTPREKEKKRIQGRRKEVNLEEIRKRARELSQNITVNLKNQASTIIGEGSASRHAPGWENDPKLNMKAVVSLRYWTDEEIAQYSGRQLIAGVVKGDHRMKNKTDEISSDIPFPLMDEEDDGESGNHASGVSLDNEHNKTDKTNRLKHKRRRILSSSSEEDKPKKVAKHHSTDENRNEQSRSGIDKKAISKLRPGKVVTHQLLEQYKKSSHEKKTKQKIDINEFLSEKNVVLNRTDSDEDSDGEILRSPSAGKGASSGHQKSTSSVNISSSSDCQKSETNIPKDVKKKKLSKPMTKLAKMRKDITKNHKGYLGGAQRMSKVVPSSDDQNKTSTQETGRFSDSVKEKIRKEYEKEQHKKTLLSTSIKSHQFHNKSDISKSEASGSESGSDNINTELIKTSSHKRSQAFPDLRKMMKDEVAGIGKSMPTAHNADDKSKKVDQRKNEKPEGRKSGSGIHSKRLHLKVQDDLKKRSSSSTDVVGAMLKSIHANKDSDVEKTADKRPSVMPVTKHRTPGNSLMQKQRMLPNVFKPEDIQTHRQIRSGHTTAASPRNIGSSPARSEGNASPRKDITSPQIEGQMEITSLNSDKESSQNDPTNTSSEKCIPVLSLSSHISSDTAYKEVDTTLPPLVDENLTLDKASTLQNDSAESHLEEKGVVDDCTADNGDNNIEQVPDQQGNQDTQNDIDSEGDNMLVMDMEMESENEGIVESERVESNKYNGMKDAHRTTDSEHQKKETPGNPKVSSGENEKHMEEEENINNKQNECDEHNRQTECDEHNKQNECDEHNRQNEYDKHNKQNECEEDDNEIEEGEFEEGDDDEMAELQQKRWELVDALMDEESLENRQKMTRQEKKTKLYIDSPMIQELVRHKQTDENTKNKALFDGYISGENEEEGTTFDSYNNLSSTTAQDTLQQWKMQMDQIKKLPTVSDGGVFQSLIDTIQSQTQGKDASEDKIEGSEKNIEPLKKQISPCVPYIQEPKLKPLPTTKEFPKNFVQPVSPPQITKCEAPVKTSAGKPFEFDNVKPSDIDETTCEDVDSNDDNMQTVSVMFSGVCPDTTKPVPLMQIRTYKPLDSTKEEMRQQKQNEVSQCLEEEREVIKIKLEKLKQELRELSTDLNRSQHTPKYEVLQKAFHRTEFQRDMILLDQEVNDKKLRKVSGDILAEPNDKIPADVLLQTEQEKLISEEGVPLLILRHGLKRGEHRELLCFKVDLEGCEAEVRRTLPSDTEKVNRMRQQISIVHHSRKSLLRKICDCKRKDEAINHFIKLRTNYMLQKSAIKVELEKLQRNPSERFQERIGYLQHREDTLERHINLFTELKEKEDKGAQYPPSNQSSEDTRTSQQAKPKISHWSPPKDRRQYREDRRDHDRGSRGQNEYNSGDGEQWRKYGNRDHSQERFNKRRHSPDRYERSRSIERHKRSHSRERHKRSCSRERHKRSRSRERHKRSHSQERHKRSHSKERHKRSHSRERHKRSHSRDRHERSHSRERYKKNLSPERYKRSPSHERYEQKRGSQEPTKSRSPHQKHQSHSRETSNTHRSNKQPDSLFGDDVPWKSRPNNSVWNRPLGHEVDRYMNSHNREPPPQPQAYPVLNPHWTNQQQRPQFPPHGGGAYHH